MEQKVFLYHNYGAQKVIFYPNQGAQKCEESGGSSLRCRRIKNGDQITATILEENHEAQKDVKINIFQSINLYF